MHDEQNGRGIDRRSDGGNARGARVTAPVTSLLDGWRDIVEDTRCLVAITEALPDSCDCRLGSGRCASCAALAASFPDHCRMCTSRVRALSPRIAVILNDTLRCLPFAGPAQAQQTVLLQRFLRDVARAMIQLLRAADAMQYATGDFRHGCRTEHILGLKRLVGRLGDAVDGARQQLHAL